MPVAQQSIGRDDSTSPRSPDELASPNNLLTHAAQLPSNVDVSVKPENSEWDDNAAEHEGNEGHKKHSHFPLHPACVGVVIV